MTICGADLVPGRAAIGKDILDRPLPERLADDGGSVVQRRAAPRPRRCRPRWWPARCGRPWWRGRRHSLRSRRRAPSSDRAAKSRTRPRRTLPLEGRLSQQSAVKGPSPAARLRSQAATSRPTAERGAVGMSEIVDDVGMIRAQPTGRRVVAIALLRHGQRDDAGFRCSQPGDQRRRDPPARPARRAGSRSSAARGPAAPRFRTV